jgi:hypothetical protein
MSEFGVAMLAPQVDSDRNADVGSSFPVPNTVLRPDTHIRIRYSRNPVLTKNA